MPTKQDIAAAFACASGSTAFSRVFSEHLDSTLRILAYHRIERLRPTASFPSDVELISSWEDEFAWQMEHVSKNYSTPSPSEVFDRIARNLPLPRRSVLVTFDDGFVDNFEIAFPILRKYQIPGIFFVSTGYIGTPDAFWFERVANAVTSTTASEVRIDSAGIHTKIPKDINQRRAISATLLNKLKSMPDTKRREAVDEAVAVLSNDRSIVDAHSAVAMSWDQAREMAAGGMEFGSHTVTHPVLANIESDSMLSHELTDSKRRIEAELGLPVTALAYPVGGQRAFSDRVVTATQAAGYQVGLTYIRGVNATRALNPFKLRRIAVERYTSRPTFAASLAIPSVFAR